MQFFSKIGQKDISLASAVQFSNEGKHLLIAGFDLKVGEVIRVYETESLNQVALLQGHSGGVLDIRFSPVDQILATASEEKTVILWDFEKNSISRTLKGHTDNVVCLDFSNCGKYLVSGSLDKTIIVWSTKIYQQVK